MFSFDIDQKRIDSAIIDFDKNGIGLYVSVLNQNVCEEGFPSEQKLIQILKEKIENADSNLNENNEKIQNFRIAISYMKIIDFFKKYTIII